MFETKALAVVEFSIGLELFNEELLFGFKSLLDTGAMFVKLLIDFVKLLNNPVSVEIDPLFMGIVLLFCRGVVLFGEKIFCVLASVETEIFFTEGSKTPEILFTEVILGCTEDELTCVMLLEFIDVVTIFSPEFDVFIFVFVLDSDIVFVLDSDTLLVNSDVAIFVIDLFEEFASIIVLVISLLNAGLIIVLPRQKFWHS